MSKRKQDNVIEIQDSDEEQSTKRTRTKKQDTNLDERPKRTTKTTTKKTNTTENEAYKEEGGKGKKKTARKSTKKTIEEIDEEELEDVEIEKGKAKGRGKKGATKNTTTATNTNTIPFKKGFKLVTKEQQIDALTLPDIPRELFPFGTYKLQNGVDQLFFPNIPHPVHEDDWLAQYNVRPQSFNKWKEIHRKIREGRNKIYFIPFGDFSEGPDLDLLVEYAKIIYAPLQIEKLPNLTFQHTDEGSSVKHTKNTRRGSSNVTTVLDTRRCHHYYEETYVQDHRQIGLDGLGRILEDVRPADAYCILGLTMEDLFTDHTDEFTVGAANMEGAGGFSFARYDPNFNNKAKNGPKSSKSKEENKRILFRRCMKVMVHELGHMFGLDHCVYFHCLMNGSGHILEDDSQPLHMCPVDLRKLTFALQDDKRSKDFSMIKKQYELLHAFYDKYNLPEDKHWAHSMLQYLNKKE